MRYHLARTIFLESQTSPQRSTGLTTTAARIPVRISLRRSMRVWLRIAAINRRGGYAVSFHAQPRATEDLGILKSADAENSKAVYAALSGARSSSNALHQETRVSY